MYNFETEPHTADEFDWVEDIDTIEHILEALSDCQISTMC